MLASSIAGIGSNFVLFVLIFLLFIFQHSDSNLDFRLYTYIF